MLRLGVRFFHFSPQRCCGETASWAKSICLDFSLSPISGLSSNKDVFKPDSSDHLSRHLLLALSVARWSNTVKRSGRLSPPRQTQPIWDQLQKPCNEYQSVQIHTFLCMKNRGTEVPRPAVCQLQSRCFQGLGRERKRDLGRWTSSWRNACFLRSNYKSFSCVFLRGSHCFTQQHRTSGWF